MKIAIFTDLLIPPAGGIEEHVLAVSQELAGRGHQVKIYAPGPLWGSNSKFLISNFEANLNDQNSKNLSIFNYQLSIVPALPAGFVWPNFRFALTFGLARNIRQWQPEVVHFHTAGPLGWFATSLAGGQSPFRIARNLAQPRPTSPLHCGEVRVVGTFHSYFMGREYLGWKAFWSPWLWRYARALYNRADAIVTPTQFVADDLARRGFKSIKAVVPTVVSLEAFKTPARPNQTEELKHRFNLTGPVLLYVGRLSREKSLDVLLKAIQKCQMSNVKCQLLLVGDGPAVGELERLSEALGIRQQVVFLGRINHDDLPQSGVYEVSSLFVLPSTSETMSIVALEAMAKGLPVVVPAGTAAAELLKDNGLTFTAGDEQNLAEKMGRVISNKEIKAQMGEASRRRAEDFSLAKVVGSLEGVYRGVLP